MNRKILLPFNPFYRAAVVIRNYLYNIDFFKSEKFDLPIICVGNLTVGGTGKTPHVEYLLSFLQNKYKTAVLSRGYKRKTSGYLLSDQNSTVESIGDEPFQIKQKFPNALVAVDEKRVRGVSNLELTTDTELVILDDAFQHRAIQPSFSIVLIDYNRPVFKDFLLPAGNLREPLSGLERANTIIVTKCPKNITKPDQQRFIKKLKLYPFQKVYFSYFDYKQPVHLLNGDATTLENKDILLVTGIANTKYLEHYLDTQVNSLKLLKYPDHHDFSSSDIKKILKEFQAIESTNRIIVCTEKDKVKLLEKIDELKEMPIYSLDIEVKFVGEKANHFQSHILSQIEKTKQNNYDKKN